MHSRQQLTEAVVRRYRTASRQGKSVILDEYCANTGYDRKYAIRKLRQEMLYPHKDRLRHKPGKASDYSSIRPLIRKLWRVSDYASAKRLHAMIPELIDDFTVNQWQRAKLLSISAATIGRLLRKERDTRRRRLNSQTKPGVLKHAIPFSIDQPRPTTPGYLEVDLVSHCGMIGKGEYVYTLNTTDIVTGWYEAEAIMGKSQKAVSEALERIAKRLPFELKGIDSDNGAEFINANVKRFADRLRINFTRSRPYKKNDNAHIEQKNWTNVRKIIGYYRLDSQEGQALLNDLYRNELRLYINFYQPSQKLIEKVRIGSKVKRKHDDPKTPYRRLIDHVDTPQDTKDQLTQLYQTLNIFELKRVIDNKIERLFDHVIKQSNKLVS